MKFYCLPKHQSRYVIKCSTINDKAEKGHGMTNYLHSARDNDQPFVKYAAHIKLANINFNESNAQYPGATLCLSVAISTVKIGLDWITF